MKYNKEGNITQYSNSKGFVKNFEYYGETSRYWGRYYDWDNKVVTRYSNSSGYWKEIQYKFVGNYAAHIINIHDSNNMNIDMEYASDSIVSSPIYYYNSKTGVTKGRSLQVF